MMAKMTQKVTKSGNMTLDENNIPVLGGDTPRAEKEIFISLSLPPRTHNDTLGETLWKAQRLKLLQRSLVITTMVVAKQLRLNQLARPEEGNHGPHAPICPGEPESYREAMVHPKKNKWQTAMQDEVNSLNDNSTGKRIDRPKDRKVFNGRCVYKIKNNEQGNIDKFRARYVAKGFI